MAEHRAAQWNTVEFWKAAAINIFVGALFLLLPAGIVLALWFNDPKFLFLTFISLIIFMAG